LDGFFFGLFLSKSGKKEREREKIGRGSFYAVAGVTAMITDACGASDLAV